LKGSCSPEVVGYGGYQDSLVSFLFVDPEYYKRGIATLLLKKVISQIGVKAWLNVAKNNIPARQLYQKFGFKIVEEFVGKYNGHDVTVLRLALRPELEAWEKRS
jgi:[ribosomal protein S18]-alanine N-acetyltransferase